MKSIVKRNGTEEPFDFRKVLKAVENAYEAAGKPLDLDMVDSLTKEMNSLTEYTVENVQDIVEKVLMDYDKQVAKLFIIYRESHKAIREMARQKQEFIESYMKAQNTASVTIDDNSNVAQKNIAVLNSEMYKKQNIALNRYRVMQKLKKLYPDFDCKEYEKDLTTRKVIYKHDENSSFGYPYCVAVSMYPLLTEGLKGLGGYSTVPQNLDSFCGVFINFVFAVSSQYAGACAASEWLLYFDYFCRKEWGEDYHKHHDDYVSLFNKRTIETQIYQYFQQTWYSLNQPAAARGYQSCFTNIAIFDRYFYEGMFGDFVFPDGTKPSWESFNWLQCTFLRWLNIERLKCLLTFPVVTVSLLYKDGKYQDEEMADFVADEYAGGNSFFTYVSDSVDSLASCCRLRNAVDTKEFSFTNGNSGVQTGSKSVITLDMNRIVQDFLNTIPNQPKDVCLLKEHASEFQDYLRTILERVYKYHTAYNELLWDLYDANLLPVYSAGFISLDKQYLTIGVNGFTASAEFMGIPIDCIDDYKWYSRLVFGTIKEENAKHRTKRTMFNTELVPAESAGIKLYNQDKEDGYWVPEDINLYTSYMFKPYGNNITVIEKIKLHGAAYIGDYIDGGCACHINLLEHPSKENYKQIMKVVGKAKCNYWTVNVPNSECNECGFITKVPIEECPNCHSEKITLYDRIIGYMTRLTSWSKGRQLEQKKRVYEKKKESYED